MDSKALPNIQILSKNIIKPSLPSPNHPKYHKLSFFDQFAPQIHVPVFLFYPLKSIPSEISSIDERLEQSLCKLLTHVYPAAGRFAANDNSHSVDCLDQGVTYIKAKVNCHFDDFINDAQKDIDLALKFCPDMVRDPSNSPLVVVQVTKFNCGGLALTISTSHCAMDGFTESKFLYEWAKVSKMGTSINDINCFTFDLGTIFPARDHSSKSLKSTLSCIRKPRDFEMVAKRFIINESAISRLRDNLGFKPSRVEMVIALLWRALVNASQQRNGRLRPCLLILSMNLRGKIDFPRYANSFGNFVIEVPVKFIPGGAETKMELPDFIILLKDTIQKKSLLFAKASSCDLYSMVAKFHDEIQQWEENDEVDVFMVSSLCSFPVYEIDFGWGKPCLTSFGLRRSDMFWLHNTECGTGIVVQADLKQSYMDMFECDQDVLAFTSKYGFPLKSFL